MYVQYMYQCSLTFFAITYHCECGSANNLQLYIVNTLHTAMMYQMNKYLKSCFFQNNFHQIIQKFSCKQELFTHDTLQNAILYKFSLCVMQILFYTNV